LPPVDRVDPPDRRRLRPQSFHHLRHCTTPKMAIA